MANTTATAMNIIIAIDASAGRGITGTTITNTGTNSLARVA
jgi:hypothetical protein